MRCRMSSCLAIDGFRILDDGLDCVPGAVVEPLEKTPVPAGMTGNSAFLFDDQQNCVVVAVEANFADSLKMTRAFALLPQPAARTRPIMRKAGGRSARKRLAVHPCQRQHRAACFLGDGRHQAVGIPDYGIEPVAHRDLSRICQRRRHTRMSVQSLSTLCALSSTTNARDAPFPYIVIPAEAGVQCRLTNLR